MNQFLMPLLFPLKPNTGEVVYSLDYILSNIDYLGLVFWITFILMILFNLYQLFQKQKYLYQMNKIEYDLKKLDDITVSTFIRTLSESKSSLFYKSVTCFKSQLEYNEEDDIDISPNPIEKWLNPEYIFLNTKNWPYSLTYIISSYTTIGVLGTFLGIMLGLQEMDLTNVAALEKSITPLLAGVSLAFRTSIWGILASLIVGFVNKNYDIRLNNSLANVVSLIQPENCNYVVKDKLFYLNETFKVQTQQLKAIQHLNTELTDKFSEQVGIALQPMVDQVRTDFETFTNKSQDTVAQTLEEIQNIVSQDQSKAIEQLVDNFSKSLGENMGDVFDRLGNTLENNLGMIETMQSNIGNISEQLTTNANNLDSIFERTGNQSEMLNSAAQLLTEKGKSFGKTIDSVNEYQETINETIKDLDKMRNEERESYNERIKNLQSSEENQTRLLENLTPLTKSLIETAKELTSTSSSLTDGTTEYVKAVEVQKAISKNLENANGRFSESLNDFIVASVNLENFGETLESEMNNLNKMTSSWESLLDDGETISKSADEWMKKVKDIFTRVTSLNDSFKELYDSNYELVKTTKDSFKSLNIDTQATLRALPEGMQRAHDDFDKTMGKISGHLAAKISDFDDTIESLDETFTKLKTGSRE